MGHNVSQKLLKKAINRKYFEKEKIERKTSYRRAPVMSFIGIH